MKDKQEPDKIVGFTPLAQDWVSPYTNLKIRAQEF